MEKTVDKKDKFNSKEKNSESKRRDGHREDGFYRKDAKQKSKSHKRDNQFNKKPEKQNETAKKREFFLENEEPALEKEIETKERHGENRKIPRPRKNVEMKICGIHACKMVFEKRPQDIIRVYEIQKDLGMFGQEYNKFAPGSNYILPKENILKHPKEFYIKLRNYLINGIYAENENYPREAFLIERGLYNLWK